MSEPESERSKKSRVIAEIEAGLEEIARNDVVSHEEMKRRSEAGAEQITWTRRASIQLENAQNSFAQDAPFAADPFVDRVLELVEELRRYSDIGRVIPEYENPRFRERVFGRYRIMYAVEEGGVRILAVFQDG